MIEPSRIHAELLAYCTRIGVAPTTFGQWVVRDFAFAASLLGGSAKVGKVALAQRFMREHPEVPRRQFGAVAKAWRERLGSGGEDPHAEAGQMVAGAAGSCAAGAGGTEPVGSITAGTLEQAAVPHNRESQAASSDPVPAGDPAAVALAFDRLGGDEAIAEGARVAVTALEAMRTEGRIWSQYQRPLADYAAAGGWELDPVALVIRPLGRMARSA